MHTQTYSDDDARWSNDRSPVPPTNTIWLFEKHRHSQKHTVHVFHKAMNEYRRFTLPLQTVLQISLLDVEYWANVAETHSNGNRIARYLEKVRSDLWAELSASPPQELYSGFQPKSTKPWAVRTNHNFGHSSRGRGDYLRKCEEKGCVPYDSEDLTSYSRLTCCD
jgi:hypothetical protein